MSLVSGRYSFLSVTAVLRTHSATPDCLLHCLLMHQVVLGPVLCVVEQLDCTRCSVQGLELLLASHGLLDKTGAGKPLTRLLNSAEA
jgi:hypothetical protein